MSNDLKQKIRELQRRNSDLNYEVRDLSKQVKKWSTYCAYVAGTSIGIIGFLQFSGKPETVQAECPEVQSVENRVAIQKVPSSNKNQLNAKSSSETTPDQNSAATQEAEQKAKLEKQRLEKEKLEKERLEKQRLEKEKLEKQRLEKERLEKEKNSFPKSHVVKSGENFSTIAQKYYKRGVLGMWLAAQNEIDPNKLQVGQKITLPEPPPEGENGVE